MKLLTVVRRHPILSYFILAYGIAWLGSIVAVGPKFMRGESLIFADGLLMFIAMVAGPSIAGLLLTGVVDGRSGLHDLCCRMVKWRVGTRWYAAAVLIPPILIFAVLLSLTVLLSPRFASLFVPAGLIIGLLTGFLEEIGWTGYAYPKMELRYGALAAALYLGLLHSSWHVVADFLGSSQTLGASWLPHFLAFMTLSMTAMRVLIVWVYCNTRSLLLAQLMHASSTGFLFMLGPNDDTLWYAVYGVVLWLVVWIVAARYGKTLMHSHNDREKTSPLIK